MKVFFRLKNRFPPNFSALIMASATSAASFRGQNVQASDQYGIRGLWSPSSVAEIGGCGDRSPEYYTLMSSMRFGRCRKGVDVLSSLRVSKLRNVDAIV